MGYLLGTDEAGYGPNLGPLVISTTVWEVPDGVRATDLYRVLADAVTPQPHLDGDRPRVPIADSKILYRPGQGLRHLERGLLAALGILGRRPARWCDAFDVLDPCASAARASTPWYADYDCPVPLDLEPAEAQILAGILAQAMKAARVRLVDMRSRVVFEDRFNRLLDSHESKGAALSHTTLGLAAEMIAPLGAGPITVVCDKHGGRNFYRDLLQAAFDDCFIEIHGESREVSLYRFGPADRRIEFRFQTKAESHLPVALASMASKYLRELAMRALNHFWCSRLPGLRPTAGYPDDARRFKADIATLQAELGIDDRLLWRAK